MSTTPAPTPESRLDLFLAHLGALLQVLIPIGQAVASPFIKNAKTQAAVAQEIPIAEGLAVSLTEVGKKE